MRASETSASYTYWILSSKGVLDGFAGDTVDESKAGEALFVLHPGAVPHILVPVLRSTKEAVIDEKGKGQNRRSRERAGILPLTW